MADDATLAAVRSAIDGLADGAVATLRDLIRVPSVNPTYEDDLALAGELRASEFVAERARELGLKVDHWTVAPGRGNVAATFGGRDASRNLLLGGHLDTVPIGAGEWRHGSALSGAIDDGRIWGRGACDMKAGVVAALFAAAALRAADVRLAGSVIAHGVVGEESGEYRLGTMAMVERGHRASAAVLGEPTGNVAPLALAIASVGWLFLEVRVPGRATHVAVRGRIRRLGAAGDAIGVNAVEKALIVVDALRHLEERWDEEKRHPLFEPGDFCIHLGVFHGGPTGLDNPAIYADSATLIYSVLHPPGETGDAVRAEVEGAIAGACAGDAWLSANPPLIRWTLDWPPASADPQGALATTARAAFADLPPLGSGPREGRFVAMQGVTDASWLIRAGIESIVAGPGAAAAAHAVDEHVPIDEFLDAIRLYAAIALRWCATV